MEREDYARARELLELAKQSGGLGAGSLQLGWLCERGLGGPPDIKRAMDLYEIARSHDVALGSYHLGSLLMRQGQSDRAMQLMAESATEGNASAAYWAYVLNQASDARRANQFLVQAAELGHAFAQRDLARQEMRGAATLTGWASALWRYWRAKARGASMAVRDVNDPRVR